MNKNPFVPQPSYTPQQPPLPPGPPPPQPTQPDYSAYWAAAAAHQQQHVQPPTVGAYNPQWSAQQPPRPPAEQSALYANYGYGTQQNSHWQQQQRQQLQQQQQHYHQPPPPVAQPPPQPPPAQPGYNPYQPTAGYPQPYVPQAVPPQPMAQPPYPHPPPPQQPQQFFSQHIQPQPHHHQHQQHQQQQQQQQQQPRHIHHTPPQHLPPAKRQRFDGPSHNNQNQHRAPPPQPQFQAPPPPAQGIGAYSGPGHGPGRGGGPPGPNHMPLGGGGARGGPSGGRGGAGAGGRGGRGGSMSGNRGGMGQRGGRGGSTYIGGSSGGGRGGGGSSGALRGHGSRGNFGGNKDFHNRRGGSFVSGGGGGYSHQNASFRGRGQGHAGSGRGGRHDGGGGGGASGALGRDGPMTSSFSSAGKKDENRRTLTDFKIVGLEIRDLGWTWGVLPTPLSPIKTEAKDEDLDVPDSQITVKNETMDEDGTLGPITAPVEETAEPDTDGGKATVEVPPTGDTQPTGQEDTPSAGGQRASSVFNSSSPPPSRIRIYFHTPVTADDSHPIPHNTSSSFSLGVTPSDSRKGKRKKLEDDDADLEEGRGPPPPPQMGSGISDDRSSVAASVAPSVAETASEGDWLMAAIVEGEDEHHPDGDDDDDEYGDQLHVSQIVEVPDTDAATEGAESDTDGNHVDMDMTGVTDHAPSVEAGNVHDPPTEGGGNGVSVVPDGLDASSSASAPELISPDAPMGVAATAEPKQDEGVNPIPDSQGLAVPEATVSASVSSSQDDPAASSASVEEQPADHVGYPDTQVPTSPLGGVPEDGAATTVNGTGHPPGLEHFSRGESDAMQPEHLPEPPASPASNTLLSTSSTSTYGDCSSQSPQKTEVKGGRIPSANRLSISYAGGNRRLVVDAEVVDKLQVFRHEGRIEVHMNIDKDSDDGLKGISMEGLSDVTKSYSPLQTLSDMFESDLTLPPFSKVPIPSTLTLIVYLDTARPLSEPKWAKSGDIQDWLKSMFGRMFWVAGDAAEGWEKKILVVDPDPPPTIWTVLEGWVANSPVGAPNERQRFLKTHMTETDNILEILLRLVRGERATPFSQSAQTISAPSISGPLLSALSQGSAHGAQQTHVSLAVLAMFRMTVEYAKKAVGDKGKGEAEERVGEIIRCLPSHLIYKSLDGIFKEWRVEKKGR